MEWEHPPMSDKLFDYLLDDVLEDLVHRLQTCHYDEKGGTIYLATYNYKTKERGWPKAEIVGDTVDKNAEIAVFINIGRTLMTAYNIPIAAFWIKKGKIVETINGDKVTHPGYMIVGMTDDNRINGAFVMTEEHDDNAPCDQPKATQTFYASEMSDTQTMDTETLYYLYKAARLTYRKMQGEKVNEDYTDTLSDNLFKHLRNQRPDHN